jgi:ribosomal protein L11 methyltransferase
MRTYPALDIRFAPDAGSDDDLRDRLLAGLDDFQPTAIQEAAGEWRVFLDSAAQRNGALAWLRDRLADPRLAVEPLDVADEDWARRSQANLKPVRAGRFVVAPPWSVEDVRRDAAAGDIVIVVVPSTGFGTGHHASTRLCLALLQRAPVAGRAVLDIGTGSGVLAIAAARLGARHVWAVDNDPDAIDAACENAALNPTDAPIAFEVGDFREMTGGPADIVVANLTGEFLRRAAADVVARVKPGGEIILSGVLAEEAPRVLAAFEDAGATLSAQIVEDEWVGLGFEVGSHQASSMAPAAFRRSPCAPTCSRRRSNPVTGSPHAWRASRPTPSRRWAARCWISPPRGLRSQR